MNVSRAYVALILVLVDQPGHIPTERKLPADGSDNKPSENGIA
jgi:hypothetical protein